MRYAIILLLLTACAGPTGQTCAQQAGPGLTQLQGIAQEWDDATKLADSTPRSGLASQIATLQSIRRKAQDVTLPECASAVKTALVDAMDNTINGFIAFLGQKPDTEVKEHFQKANDKMAAFSEAVIKLNTP